MIAPKRIVIRCPYHKENTGSCHVDLVDDIYHCFGCGKQGTLMDLIIFMSVQRNEIEPTHGDNLSSREVEFHRVLVNHDMSLAEHRGKLKALKDHEERLAKIEEFVKSLAPILMYRKDK
jgi:hypothetical protein